MSHQAFTDMVTHMPVLSSQLREPHSVEKLVRAYGRWRTQHRANLIMRMFLSVYRNLFFAIQVVMFVFQPCTKVMTRTSSQRGLTRRSHHSSCQPVISTTRMNLSLKMARTHHSRKRRRRTRPLWQTGFIAFTITVAFNWTPRN
ncbi:hypothetical protein CPB85DRAFT_1302877 [Mucidula mucida]|nr:hypothetical protein CPB85DRAFT_1302877 [Mucidula mucida]